MTEQPEPVATGIRAAVSRRRPSVLPCAESGCRAVARLTERTLTWDEFTWHELGQPSPQEHLHHHPSLSPGGFTR